MGGAAWTVVARKTSVARCFPKTDKKSILTFDLEKKHAVIAHELLFFVYHILKFQKEKEWQQRYELTKRSSAAPPHMFPTSRHTAQQPRISAERTGRIGGIDVEGVKAHCNAYATSRWSAEMGLSADSKASSTSLVLPLPPELGREQQKGKMCQKPTLIHRKLHNPINPLNQLDRSIDRF